MLWLGPKITSDSIFLDPKFLLDPKKILAQNFILNSKIFKTQNYFWGPNYLSLFEQSIKSENFFYKSCSVWYAIWEWGIKSESLAAIYGTVTFNICYQTTAIYNLLSVTCYLNLFIWNLLLLAKTCSFRSLLYVS